MHRTSKRIGMWVLAICALCVLGLAAPTAWTQENSAGIQGTVKDQTGAVIAGATVEISGPALAGIKSWKTDASGWFRFANLPPGVYNLEVTADGFRKYRATNIELNVGRMPTRDVSLEIGAVTAMVEVSAAGAVVDVSQSRVQTVVTESSLQNLPMGRSFQAAIQYAPGARNEPLQGGFQIDGASNSENSYLVEGQETADIRSGASNTNVPREFIQEVQIKSSGFEAEFGGALGGVVNVIGKRGGNVWHGSVFSYFQSDNFDSAPNQQLRKDPTIPRNLGGQRRLDQPAQYYFPKQDHYRYMDPGFEAGGKLIQDRLWLFTSFVPRILNTRREVLFSSFPAPTKVSINQQSIIYYAVARADILVTQNIRVFASWQNNYSRTYGGSLPNADDATGKFNTTAGNNVVDYTYSIGNVQPRVLYNVGGDWTILPSLVATTRYGYVHQDYQDRGLPIGNRYMYRDSNYSYSTGVGTTSAASMGLDGTTLGVGNPAINSAGFASIGANYATSFDKFSRLSFSQDLAYFKKGFGTHNLKGGYSFNRLKNDIIAAYNSADIYVAFLTEYFPNSAGGQANCAAIVATNTLLYGLANAGGDPAGASCRGNWGTVNLRDLKIEGKVGSKNHALYFQDSWTVAKGLTLNLGIRFDKESLPSYNSSFLGINFGFADKVAPRLGAAWDVFGNGKLKVSGSYAWFYDIMKYEMPRGSFGGDYWHDCVYAMDITTFATILPARDAAGHYCPLSGGANGTIPAGLRFIENFDFRQPSNDPSSPGSLGATGLVEPKLKPMKQNAVVLGAEWMVMPNLVFEARYTRKRLVRTIEDTGIITTAGEQYYISNPGELNNVTVPSFDCTGCPINAKASRRYDGVEFRLTRRGGSKWYGQVSYTYSRLRGNYSGLTATDVSDGGGARNSPNVDRAFDEPFMSFDAHGKKIDGPLATDRPNTFKAVGWYTHKWWNMETTIGGFQQVYQGSPLSSYISVNFAPVFVEGRGNFVNVTRDATPPGTAAPAGNFVLGSIQKGRRTPMFSATDMSLSHKLHVSKNNENMMIGFEADVFNMFNQHAVTLINQNLARSGSESPKQCTVTPGCPVTNLSGINYKELMAGYDYIAGATAAGITLNSLYGLPYGYQNPREVRFKVMFIF